MTFIYATSITFILSCVFLFLNYLIWPQAVPYFQRVWILLSKNLNE